MDATLRDQLAAWREQDPDVATAAALDDLLARADAGDTAAAAELADAFAGPLEFGTAGLRARLPSTWSATRHPTSCFSTSACLCATACPSSARSPPRPPS